MASKNQIISNCIENKDPFLDLGNLYQTSFDDKFEKHKNEFVHIRQVNFSDQWDFFDLNRMQWITEKSKNIGASNKIKSLPKLLPPKTRSLIASIEFENDEKGLIDNIAPISSLHELFEIYFDNNHIKDLTPLRSLKVLRNVYLAANKISDIYSLKGLNRIEILDLSFNLIEDIGPISELTNLKVLDLSYNKLTNIDCLKNLKELKSLNLSGNEIIDISVIKHLTKLEKIELDFNNIKDISVLYGFTSLKILGLNYNSIDYLPLNSFKLISKLEVLRLHGNYVRNIPVEILRNNPHLSEVKSYFQAQLQGSAVNTEYKIVWIGNGEVGKTTLACQLKGEDFVSQNDRTHGVVINKWKIPQEKYSVNLLSKFENLTKGAGHSIESLKFPSEISIYQWDFGGQEYYHSTHRLFLSSNVLYVLVWDSQADFQDEEKGNFPKEYWKQIVNHFAPENTIITVQNKVKSGFAGNPENLEFKVQYRDENLNNIQKFKLDIEDLKDAIIGQLCISPHLSTVIPNLYEEIRRSVRRLNRPVISFSEFTRLCSESDFTQQKLMHNEEQLRTITNFLHETGTIICYKYNSNISSQLKNYVFTDPLWLTESLYLILNKELTLVRDGFLQGEFTFDHVNQVISSNSRLSDSLLNAADWIELLIEFELIFYLKREDIEVLIAPQYLPKNCYNSEALSYALDRVFHIGFIIQFPKFLPPELFLRFISFYGSNSERFLYWKTGIFFKLQGLYVFAKCNYVSREIEVTLEEKDDKVCSQLLKWFTDRYETTIHLSVDAVSFVKLEKLRSKILSRKLEIDIIDSNESLMVSEFKYLFWNEISKIDKMNNANLNPDFIIEMKTQIKDELEALSDLNFRRSITRNQNSRSKYELLISQIEENISFIETRFLGDLQKAQNISYDESQVILNSIKTEVENSLFESEFRIRKMLDSVQENTRNSFLELINLLPSEYIESAENILLYSSELTEKQKNRIIDLTAKNLPVKFEKSAYLKNYLDSTEIAVSSKFKLAIPIIPLILNYEIDFGPQFSKSLPEIWKNWLNSLKN